MISAICVRFDDDFYGDSDLGCNIDFQKHVINKNMKYDNVFYRVRVLGVEVSRLTELEREVIWLRHRAASLQLLGVSGSCWGVCW